MKNRLFFAVALNLSLAATAGAVKLSPSGVGEVVIVVRGSSARQTTNMANVPTDTSIVAIVDSVELKGKIVFSKSE